MVFRSFLNGMFVVLYSMNINQQWLKIALTEYPDQPLLFLSLHLFDSINIMLQQLYPLRKTLQSLDRKQIRLQFLCILDHFSCVQFKNDSTLLILRYFLSKDCNGITLAPRCFVKGHFSALNESSHMSIHLLHQDLICSISTKNILQSITHGSLSHMLYCSFSYCSYL